MEQTLTISIQDYLKNIYELTENGETASTNEAAKAESRIRVARKPAVGLGVFMVEEGEDRSPAGNSEKAHRRAFSPKKN